MAPDVKVLISSLCFLPSMGKFARFSVFARGRIVGKAEEGASQQRIRRTVLKKDGRRGSLRAIQGIIEHSRKKPDYDGTSGWVTRNSCNLRHSLLSTEVFRSVFCV